MLKKNIEELVGNEILAQAVLSSEYHMILSEGAIIKPEYINKLRELGITYVYLKEDPKETEEIVILKADVENKIKTRIKDILEQHTYQHNQDLIELAKTADNIIENIISEEQVMERVYDIKQRNADVYEHSLSVCTLAIMTSLKLKLPEVIIHDIGIACLLHDIGLRYLTLDYENRGIEDMSVEDASEYKKHAVYGYSSLKNETWISEISKNIILYHHERQDGTGYPIHATIIPVEVGVVNVCDTFDEMICGIGYKRVKVHEAVEYLRTLKNMKFDSRIVDAFLKFTAVYPAGTKVMTNQGELAIVVRQNKEFQDRPILRVLKDKNGELVMDDVFINLLEVHNVFIEKVMDN